MSRIDSSADFNPRKPPIEGTLRAACMGDDTRIDLRTDVRAIADRDVSVNGSKTIVGNGHTFSGTCIHVPGPCAEFTIDNMRIRPGANTKNQGCLSIHGNEGRIGRAVVSHCHLGDGTDTCLSFGNVDVGRVERCIIGPGLPQPEEREARRLSKGSVVGGEGLKPGTITFDGCLFLGQSRLPRIVGGRVTLTNSVVVCDDIGTEIEAPWGILPEVNLVNVVYIRTARHREPGRKYPDWMPPICVMAKVPVYVSNCWEAWREGGKLVCQPVGPADKAGKALPARDEPWGNIPDKSRRTPLQVAAGVRRWAGTGVRDRIESEIIAAAERG